jgi:hypothetical protein
LIQYVCHEETYRRVTHWRHCVLTLLFPGLGLVDCRNVTGSITATCNGGSWSIFGSCGDVTSEQQQQQNQPAKLKLKLKSCVAFAARARALVFSVTCCGQLLSGRPVCTVPEVSAAAAQVEATPADRPLTRLTPMLLHTCSPDVCSVCSLCCLLSCSLPHRSGKGSHKCTGQLSCSVRQHTNWWGEC